MFVKSSDLIVQLTKNRFRLLTIICELHDYTRVWGGGCGGGAREARRLVRVLASPIKRCDMSPILSLPHHVLLSKECLLIRFSEVALAPHSSVADFGCVQIVNQQSNSNFTNDFLASPG